MSNFVRDGSFATIALVNAPRFIAPIPGVNTHYIIEQDCMVDAADYVRTALGTAHPDYADFLLMEEKEPTEISGTGTLQWVRVYAKKPASHTEPSTYTYNFIGFYGSWGTNIAVATGRDRKSIRVPAQVLHEYFWCGAGGGGRDYASFGAVPVVSGQKYWRTDVYQETDWLTAAAALDPSTPTREDYQAMIADANSNKWSATTGKIVAEDSTIDRWIGEYFVRKTIYILAQ